MILNEVETSRLQKIEASLAELKDLLTGRNAAEMAREKLTKAQVLKMLGICSKTFHNYHKQGILPIIHIGRKIYCERSDIENLMRRNRINPLLISKR
ncbi:MAG: helix-turn-helix domain-containing protein [Bacteroidia bacterium]|nr:helix-turn-helix domain-containing protein [Bacteroidia bacterium]